jgi:branched-chain amino acid transport system ATP-binding protein
MSTYTGRGDANQSLSATETRPALDVQRAKKSYGHVCALDQVNLRVEFGEIVGLIGPNGSGKTTLTEVITGSQSPDSGKVLLEGDTATRWSVQRRCHWGISRARQIPRPFTEMDVLENVLVAATFGRGPRGVRRAAHLVAEETVERLGLSSYRTARPDELSGEKLKLLELARAIATQPRILVLDEVLAGLTDGEVAPIVDLIEEKRKDGVAILFIEHRLNTVWRLCDRVYVLDYGQMIKEGGVEDVRVDKEVHRAYFGTE